MCPILNTLMEKCFQDANERIELKEIMSILDAIQCLDDDYSTIFCLFNKIFFNLILIIFFKKKEKILMRIENIGKKKFKRD